MSSFTKSQSIAVRHQDGPLMVLAGPGSGKTTVVTRRVQYMVQEYGIPASSILVITFTKAAAAEMKERFLRLMKEEHTTVSFGTFHAVFFSILKLAYGFNRRTGLPVCLGDLELTKEDRLEDVLAVTMANQELVHTPYPVTGEMIYQAIQELEEYREE